MTIILTISSAIEFALIFYFVGEFYAMGRQNAKDINAIAVRLRAIEDTIQMRDAANSFRLDSLEKSLLNIGGSGPDLDGLRCHKKAP